MHRAIAHQRPLKQHPTYTLGRLLFPPRGNRNLTSDTRHGSSDLVSTRLNTRKFILDPTLTKFEVRGINSADQIEVITSSVGSTWNHGLFLHLYYKLASRACVSTSDDKEYERSKMRCGMNSSSTADDQ